MIFFLERLQDYLLKSERPSANSWEQLEEYMKKNEPWYLPHTQRLITDVTAKAIRLLEQTGKTTGVIEDFWQRI